MRNRLIALLLFIPELLVAHPGHDDDLDGGYSIHHYLTSPYHLSIGAAVTVFAIFAVWFVRGKKETTGKNQNSLKNA